MPLFSFRNTCEKDKRYTGMYSKSNSPAQFGPKHYESHASCSDLKKKKKMQKEEDKVSLSQSVFTTTYCQCIPFAMEAESLKITEPRILH